MNIIISKNHIIIVFICLLFLLLLYDNKDVSSINNIQFNDPIYQELMKNRTMELGNSELKTSEIKSDENIEVLRNSRVISVTEKSRTPNLTMENQNSISFLNIKENIQHTTKNNNDIKNTNINKNSIQNITQNKDVDKNTTQNNNNNKNTTPNTMANKNTIPNNNNIQNITANKTAIQNTYDVMNSTTYNLGFVIINNKMYKTKDYTPEQLQKIKDDHTYRKAFKLEFSNAKVLKHMNFSGYSNKDRKYLKSHMHTYVQRTKKIKEVCEFNPDIKESEHLNLVWDLDHKPNLIWCPQYKVASTSWMMNFLRLKHFNEDNPKLTEMRKSKRKKLQYKKSYGASHSQVFDLYPKPDDIVKRRDIWKNGVRFLIVRHPFTRILSAYRDKMTKLNPKPKEFNFRQLQLEIIKTYRKSKKSNRSQFPTFSEFVDYVIESTKSLVSAEDWNNKVNCWVPYWAHCSVCSSDYTIVMKLETMNEDEKFLITLANLEELKKTKEQEWRHLHNVSSIDAAKDYYSELTRAQISDLYLRYKLDFDLFDYSVKEYLDIAKD